jgi:hypothetical protein
MYIIPHLYVVKDFWSSKNLDKFWINLDKFWINLDKFYNFIYFKVWSFFECG